MALKAGTSVHPSAPSACKVIDMSEKAQNILVLGAGGFAQEIADLLSDIPGTKVVAFVHDLEHDHSNSELDGIPIVHVGEINSKFEGAKALAAIGSPTRSQLIEKVAKLGFEFTRLKHPGARLSRTARLGEGSILSAGCVVAAHTDIGRHCIVNRGALVGHHTRIEDYVTLGPGANVAGSCSIGAGVTLGMGAMVLDGHEIGARSVVGSGAVVTRDVPRGVVVMGTPAKS